MNKLSGSDSGTLEALRIGQDVSAQIAVLQVAVSSFNGFLDDALKPLAPLLIPTDAGVTHYQNTFFVDNVLASIKIDFSSFDYDNDGVSENCSGHTAALPICYRIWVGDEKRTAGIFETYPTTDNPGKGRFKGVPIGNIEGLIGVIYDHSDPLNKTTEIFTGDQPSNDDPQNLEFSEAGHGLLTQTGEASSAEKTVNFSFEGSGFIDRQIGRFREDSDFLSFSRDLSGIEQESYTAACASISTRIVVENDNCSAIDVGGIPFVDFLTNDQVLPPDDFPDAPTF